MDKDTSILESFFFEGEFYLLPFWNIVTHPYVTLINLVHEDRAVRVKTINNK